jgi:UDP-N-acetylmuramate dehydrogenase
MDELYKKLKEYGRVRINEPLAKHTTFQIGGPARYFIKVEEKEKLPALLNLLRENSVRFFIIGGGSNVLWPDSEYDGVVIQFFCGGKPELNTLGASWNVYAPACIPLGSLVSFCAENSLTGMEWAVGIPGTVGGAVRGNAGAMGRDTSQSVVSADVWRDGEILAISKADCTFSYRDSVFKNNGDVLLGARFSLPTGDKKQIMAEIQKNVSHRLSRVPKQPSAGSFFKNIRLEKWPGDINALPELFRQRGTVPVGWLVEQLGMKGYAAGGAKIADDHGNFIINTNGATQSDVLTIVEEVKDKVYNKFGVEPELEVQIVRI